MTKVKITYNEDFRDKYISSIGNYIRKNHTSLLRSYLDNYDEYMYSDSYNENKKNIIQKIGENILFFAIIHEQYESIDILNDYFIFDIAYCNPHQKILIEDVFSRKTIKDLKLEGISEIPFNELINHMIKNELFDNPDKISDIYNAYKEEWLTGHRIHEDTLYMVSINNEIKYSLSKIEVKEIFMEEKAFSPESNCKIFKRKLNNINLVDELDENSGYNYLNTKYFTYEDVKNIKIDENSEDITNDVLKNEYDSINYLKDLVTYLHKKSEKENNKISDKISRGKFDILDNMENLLKINGIIVENLVKINEIERNMVYGVPKGI